MVYLEINKKNHASGNNNLIEKLNKHLAGKNNKTFILFYMEGCGPCNAARPEWAKLKNVLSNNFLNREDIVIISIDKDLTDKLKNIGKEPFGFPTIRYIANEGKINENYEDSDITIKDRTIDSFVEWVKTKSGENNITKSEDSNAYPKHYKNATRKKRTKSKTKKHYGGKGKWSIKYKRNINCKKPKGFSQKQYCKYGRK